MIKFILNILLFFFLTSSYSYSNNNEEFNLWLDNFKIEVKKEGVSNKTINDVLGKARFLSKVIEYDRRQPEFYEDTKTYINKRANKSRVSKGINIYNSNKKLIDQVENKFGVEKELLISLMGIETNYGTYLGKMDIISSLATLSFDLRRRDFFKNELLTLLKLIDNRIINPQTLYGSWAGALGNFQFMPSTIKKFAIDYNQNNKIDLKNIEDSIASAANYINKMGWKKNDLCYIKIELNENIPNKYLNSSAKKIKNHAKIKKLKKYIKNYESYNLNENIVSAIIIPDKDIIPDSDTLQPAFLIFHNYELILKWNRSLRFALAVCTLKDLIKDEL
tara:strand:+ start:383 stop:1384 length:1002 start_codon:yes stop_codon:yes gene_type:complete